MLNIRICVVSGYFPNNQYLICYTLIYINYEYLLSKILESTQSLTVIMLTALLECILMCLTRYTWPTVFYTQMIKHLLKHLSCAFLQIIPTGGRTELQTSLSPIVTTTWKINTVVVLNYYELYF